jgi:HK97 family phage portal protein
MNFRQRLQTAFYALGGSSIPIDQRGTNSPAYELLVGLPTASGKTISRAQALRIDAVLTAIKTICDDTVKLPLNLMEHTEQNGLQRTRQPVEDPLYAILKWQPNPHMTARDLRWINMFHLQTTGNYYNQVIRDTTGRVKEIWPLASGCVAERWEGTNLFFDYSNGHEKRTFLPSEIWHCSIMGDVGIAGRTLILLAREAIGLLAGSEEMAARYFGHGLQMSGFVSVPAGVNITKKQGDDLVKDLTDKFSGSGNAWQVSVLPYGADFKKMGLTADETQFIDSRKFQVENVIRLWGGAALMTRLAVGEKNATFASSAAFLNTYYEAVILPYTDNIEQTIRRDLIRPADKTRLYAKHNEDVILRGDPETRTKVLREQKAGGFLTGNEGRILLDRDPIPGNDFIEFPANTALFDPKTGKIFIPAQATPAAPGTPAATAQLRSARLKAIASSLAERIERKEKSKDGVTPKFVAEVLNVTMEQATEYWQKRTTGEITAEQAHDAIVALVVGGKDEATT